MNKRIFHIPFFAVLLMLIAICVTGCNGKQVDLPSQGSQAAQSPNEVVVYFTKSRGMKSVTEGVVRQIPAEYHGSELEFAVRELLQGPNQEESRQGYFSEIPKGTRLIAVEEQDGKLKVDLSRQFVAGGGSNTMQQRLAELKQTILETEKNKQVSLSVEGKPLEALGGEGIEVDQPLKRPIQ
jgi:spore germination protein GerM